MNLNHYTPLVIYDNACYLCVKFAKSIEFFSRGKIRFVGHYTDFGEKIRNEVLGPSATEMFWFIDEKMAYGGRAALFPMIATIIKSKGIPMENEIGEEFCDNQCKHPKTVFLRSASLLTNSRRIKIK